MSQKREKRRRYTRRQRYLMELDLWARIEPPRWKFWKWFRWLKTRPVVFTPDPGSKLVWKD